MSSSSLNANDRIVREGRGGEERAVAAVDSCYLFVVCCLLFIFTELSTELSKTELDGTTDITSPGDVQPASQPANTKPGRQKREAPIPSLL